MLIICTISSLLGPDSDCVNENDCVPSVKFIVYSNELTPVSAIPYPENKQLVSAILNEPSPVHSADNIIWDFGDGTTYTGLSAVHTYDWPGEYNVNMSIINAAGNPVNSAHTKTVTVHDFIPTQSEFNISKNVYDIPAGQTVNPIQVDFMMSWQNYKLNNRAAPGCDSGEQHHIVI